MTNEGKLFDLNLKVGDVVVVDEGNCVGESFTVTHVPDHPQGGITMIGPRYEGLWYNYTWPDNIWKVVSRASDTEEPDIKPMHPDEAVRLIEKLLEDAGMELENIGIKTQEGGHYNA